ncbi:MAG: hypothetical protein PHI71_12410 [Acidiphilium sp.]|jgi:predicted glycosyltransferase|nr:hypothetical protein [Acidiphilium sp.]
MSRPVFYYVHHQGRGHLDRALAIASHAPREFVLLGTGLAGRTADIASIDLADDQPTRAPIEDATAPALHYAPRDHPGIRSRVAAIATAIDDHAPGLFIVDVSVEIALLAVIASVPMAYVRLSGDRYDPPHETIFRAAHHLIAPFHRDLDDPVTPRWIMEKTRYIPGLTRATPSPRHGGRIVLVVAGQGGPGYDGDLIAAAAEATPDHEWRCIGPVTPAAAAPSNLAILGWSETPAQDIAEAAIVVGGAGDGLVGAVLAVNRPFICIPEARPYHEQQRKAAALRRLGAAIVTASWPAPALWPDLLARAARLDPEIPARLHDPTAPARAVDDLLALANAA